MNGVFDLWVVLPTVTVAVYALLLLVLSPALRGSRHMPAGIATMAILLAGAAIWRDWGLDASTAYGMVQADSFSRCFHLAFLATGLMAVLLSSQYLERVRAHHAEYYALILIALAGMMTMSASANLLVLFTGLEMLSIPLYVLSGLTRTRPRSVESSLKYFLLGAFSTGFVVYGLALIYGATGTLDVTEIVAARATAPLLLAGMGLVFIGFAFKVAAVPFHAWAPDVYQGAPTVVTAFMAAGTKAAAFAALLRILVSGFAGANTAVAWTNLAAVLAVLTMTVANVTALAQTNVKRMLAWSSVAHAGYLLIALATVGRGIVDRGAGEITDGGPAAGAQALGFYLISYAFMTAGAFGVAMLVGRDAGPDAAEQAHAPAADAHGDEGYSLAAYDGLGRRRPALAAAMTIFMLSLAGLPPTAGFIGKFYIFKGAVDVGLLGLAIAGGLNAVIGAAYYLRIVVAMYFKPATDDTAGAPATASSAAALVVAVGGTLVLGLAPGPVLALAREIYGALR